MTINVDPGDTSECVCIPVTEQPDATRETKILSSQSTNTVLATLLGRAKVEAKKKIRKENAQVVNKSKYSLVSSDLPGLATPAKAGLWDRVAREGVEALLLIGKLRAGNRSVELLDIVGRTIHDGGAGVDDGLEVVDDGLATRDGRSTGCQPEAEAVVDLVVLDVAGELGGVGAAEVEGGALLGEVEGELASGDLLLLDGAVEERVL